jgi:hypothetical protein
MSNISKKEPWIHYYGPIINGGCACCYKPISRNEFYLNPDDKPVCVCCIKFRRSEYWIDDFVGESTKTKQLVIKHIVSIRNKMVNAVNAISMKYTKFMAKSICFIEDSKELTEDLQNMIANRLVVYDEFRLYLSEAFDNNQCVTIDGNVQPFESESCLEFLDMETKSFSIYTKKLLIQGTFFAS